MTVTALDTLLPILSDRGIVNEDAFAHVCLELFEGHPLTREQLIAIFGHAAVYHCVTTKDETARQLVREALALFSQPECRIDLRDWVRQATKVVGPIT